VATVVVVSDLVDLVMEMDGANVKDKLSGAKLRLRHSNSGAQLSHRHSGGHLALRSLDSQLFHLPVLLLLRRPPHRASHRASHKASHRPHRASHRPHRASQGRRSRSPLRHALPRMMAVGIPGTEVFERLNFWILQ